MLRDLPAQSHPNLLVGTETHDDAGVYRINDDTALVQTIDFFPPVVNDPFLYGQIAAANSLSDIYAMGGKPITGLNLVGYPDDKDPQLTWLGDILKGGAERFAKAGAVILGGHTVRDSEIKFGYAVTGLVHPDKFLTNAAAKPGDKLILTKPLGTGFVTTAHKRGDCPEPLFQAAVASMSQLNDVAAAAMIEAGAHAATDVTGFGLAGHAYEMARGSGTTIIVSLSRLPLLPGAEGFAKKPFLTRASASNLAYVSGDLRKQGKLDPVRLEFFFDAQTSGGLLISLPGDRAEGLLKTLHERGISVATIIGEVVTKQDKALVLTE